MRAFFTIAVFGFSIGLLAREQPESTHKDPLGTITHQVPPVVGPDAKQTSREMNPGITREFRFRGKENAAVLVVTRIREDYPKDDTLLVMQRPRSVAMQKHFGETIVRLRSLTVGERMLDEVIFINCAYNDQTYPYGTGGADLKGEVREVSIQQTFVSNGRYIECALHLKRKEAETPGMLITRAQEACTAWAQSVSTSGGSAKPEGSPDASDPEKGAGDETN